MKRPVERMGAHQKIDAQIQDASPPKGNLDMADIHSRTRLTATFRGNRLAAWCESTVGIIGCGLLGSRLAVEVVRSGANVWLCDFDAIDEHDAALYAERPNVSKVAALVAACEQIRPGSASGKAADVRHVGVGVLRGCDVLIDCTDDARLAFPLTETSNGLEIPLLRAAVDGSGEYELGRVLCSDPRDGGACQLCSRAFDDLWRVSDRTPCLGNPTEEPRLPTLAGGAIASSVTGLALLQAQRLITGNDAELVQSREVIIDLSHLQMMSMKLPRSSQCISGHEAWEVTEVPSARVRTLRELFAEAASRLGDDDFVIEPHGHPLCVEADCPCGARACALGTANAETLVCRQCDEPMTRRSDSQRAVIERRMAEELRALDYSLGALGFPDSGAMFTARSNDRPPLRMVLAEGAEK